MFLDTERDGVVFMDSEFLNTRIIKSFRHVSSRDLPDAPVHALKGLSEGDAKLLYDSFYVKTIRDLADLKYVIWAQEICALRDVPPEKIDMASFEKKLIKAYEQTPIRKLMKSPVHALQGLSEADGKRLEQAFRVKTVQNLARLKFAHYAHEICREAYADMSAPIRPGEVGEPILANSKTNSDRPSVKWLWLLLAVFGFVAIVIALVVLGLRFKNNSPEPATSIENSPNEKQASDKSQINTQIINPSEKFHIVESQDNLFDISKRHYGTSARWPEIHKLNSDVIVDPNKIFPGTKLRLP